MTESEAAVIEFLGAFSRVVGAGCFIVWWPFESVRTRASLKVKYLEVSCETKTLDNVFVRVAVAIQYNVIFEKVASAVYKLSDPRAQITSYVHDVVRSSVPRLTLDDAFASKDAVADSVKNQLKDKMEEYGFEIKAALVIDLDPNNQIKNAMNDINAQSRIRAANAERAEAEKILQVKAAEADAEAKYLSGLGVARQRKALVDGLRETVTSFSSDVKGTTSSDVMDLLLVTQYFDMIKDIGLKNDSGATLFLPHGPAAVNNLREEMMKQIQH